jgi:hypothetical protein
MQQIYKSRSTAELNLPERNFELRIREGLVVIFLLTVLTIVLF